DWSNARLCARCIFALVVNCCNCFRWWYLSLSFIARVTSSPTLRTREKYGQRHNGRIESMVVGYRIAKTWDSAKMTKSKSRNNRKHRKKLYGFVTSTESIENSSFNTRIEKE
ncbi:unnamed protein product, partial [Pylaiella littoralis]